MKRGFVALLAVGAFAGDASADATRLISLRYSAVLAKADFPSPAARLTVNGREAWFLVDTGAGVHVVASWFVDAAGLKVDDRFGEEVRGVDATGQPYAFRGLRNLAAQLDDGSALTVAVTAVADFPAEFQQFEIGGILNPQLLAGSGRAAALDLRVPELRLEPFEQAVQRLRARVLPRDQVQVCTSPEAAVPNLLVAVAVSAGGRKGMLTVDSGAGVTKIVAGSGLVRGVRLAPGGQTTGLAGKPQPFGVARGMKMKFGESRATLDVRVVEEAAPVGCGPDGFLGLDALRACAVVLSASDLAITCRRMIRPGR